MEAQPEKEVHWVSQAVSNYHKSTIWFVVAIALCALKAATSFTVFLAYFQVFFRAIQLLALGFGKRRIARLAYGIATGAIFLMLLSAALNDMVSNVIED